MHSAALPAFLAGILVAAGAAQAEPAIGGLRYIGRATVPNEAMVDGTLVGGLSGLAYDPKTGLWYVLSDDRSDKAPARFYAAELTYGGEAFTEARMVRAVTLKTAGGQPYPNRKTGGDVQDPESISIDPQTGNLWWGTEADRKLGISPAVHISTPEGAAAGEIAIPAMFTVHPGEERGPRDNLGFEGLSFSPDGRSVWVAMESALYEDGPVATVDAGTTARLTRISRDGEVIAQYAYPLDPIQAKPTGKSADNGLSEFIALDDTRGLALERSGVEGADGIWTLYIRVYETDTAGAADVKDVPALAGTEIRPVSKRLVLDLSKDPAIGRVDNIEAMSFGPLLPNGHRSLVLASDNNFNPASQVTEFLLFDVLP